MALIANDIYIGSVANPNYHFTNRSVQIGSINGIFTVDVIANELSIDTFSFIVRYKYDKNLVYAPNGKDGYRDTNGKIYRLAKGGIKQYVNFVPSGSDEMLDSLNRVFRTFAGYASGKYLDLPFGTPVYWYMSGSFYRKGYMQSVDRVGKYAWKVSCISGIGLLDAKMHGGGLYAGTTFSTIARDIIGSSFGVTFSEEVSGVAIYGHLPYDTARNNLHRLLFAVGAAMLRNTAATDYKVDFLNPKETSVPPSRIALGGSVDYQLPSNTVEVTEHGFFQTAADTDTVVFDNTQGIAAENQVVVFKDAPVYDLQVASGSLTINELGVNYAVVSGTGTLTAKPYTHTRQIVRLSDKSGSEPERLRQVTNNELISAVNSLNVAKRVLAYYKSSKTVKAKMMMQGEQGGAMLSTTDAFGELTTAILSRMSVLPTTVLGADIELIDGYVPGNSGNNFNNRIFVSASGTVTIPAGVTYIRIVLVGGGQGGQGGYDGMPGLNPLRTESPGDEYMRWYYSLSGIGSQQYHRDEQGYGKGGAAGNAGVAGKVLAIERNVSPGETITITVGTGGAGGASNGTEGAAGTETTARSTSLGILTSANGSVGAGYYDALADIVFGAPGENGTDGGDGGFTDTSSLSADNGSNGLKGGNAGDYQGGAGGVGKDTTVFAGSVVKASGGGGGGAAYGAAGNAGGNSNIVSRGSAPWYLVYAGDGGNGSDALAPDDASYGNGGAGGNGGGGGGNGGGFYCEDVDQITDPYYGHGGTAGLGSAGGKGGDGCVIIYY